MNAETLLQSKLNKVKSFIDNESFVFTFSKTNAFAINKDQLFKNQIYKTYIDHNGYEINERKNNPFIKNEKITQILNKNFLFNSSRISINDIEQNIVYEPKENEIEINSKKFKIKENISKIDNANGKIFYNDDNKIKSINISNLNNLTIYFEDKDEPFKPFKLYKSTIPFDFMTFYPDNYRDLIFIDDYYYGSGTNNLENKKHIILCQDVELLKNVTINEGKSLINYIVETSESKSNFKFDRASEEIYSDDYYYGDTIKFYNDGYRSIKVASIKKKCTSMDFYYEITDSDNSIYLYIDGNYYNKYSYNGYGKTPEYITGLTNEEHEFTWVFNNYYYSESSIYTISFNNEDLTDSSLVTNNYDNDIFGSKYINNEIKENIINNIIKVDDLGFYKISKSNNDKKIYLYIDYDNFDNYDNSFYCRCIAGDIKYNLYPGINLIETEATEIYIDIFQNRKVYFSVLTDNHIFNKNELIKYNKEASIVLYSDEYKNGNNSSTPFYNDATGSKIVSIKKTCSKMSFYYKGSCVYLYIDGSYYNRYSDSSWTLASIDNLTNKEHEFTWVLYNTDDHDYSCIDTISFNDVVETDSSLFSNTYDNELRNEFYKNGDNSSTPFYNDTVGSKVVSIKKTCSKMSFYYKTRYSNNSYNHIYLYIDGKYYNRYYNSNNTWTLTTVNNLTNKEHEFTWVLYNNTDGDYSCIDTIAFNDVVETDSSLFSNTYDNELQNINSTYKNEDISSTPFYNDTIDSKVVSIKKTCSKMSFYYKTRYYNNSYSYVCLYIDGKYYNKYYNKNTWTLESIDNLSNKEHEFTWVLYNTKDSYYSCIDTISFDDVVETNSSLFSNTYDNELQNINSTYKNGSNSSTPFYNDAIGSKVVSIKKTCSKMSFYYKTKNDNSYTYIYLYIDGKYYNRYYNSNNTWTLTTVNNLTNKEHEFTWVLYNYSNDYYSCIDTISFDDVVETDSNLFSNTYDNELQNINSTYKNGDNSSTPFYNDASGIKVVSIKKTCSKMSFYYKTRNNGYKSSNYIYLYIDGKYYDEYSDSNNAWSLITVDNLSNKEHEFTWVLYCYGDIIHSCIDTIAFNDVVEMDSSLFSNTYDNELKNNNSKYKNGYNSSTPFYNDTVGSKVVSIKKTCSKMSFYYKTKDNNSYNHICLYIDGNYYNKYYNKNTWTLTTVNNLTNKEHEFTWVLYNYTDDYYSCIDTIAFNDVVEMDSSLFSNTYDNELLKNEFYKNGYISSTPFYNDAAGFKVVSIKKTCSKMSFYYKTKDNDSYTYIYLYIDGKYYNKYNIENTWTSTSIDNLSNKEHEFTWVLYNNNDSYYSCIDTISFDDVVEIDSNLFSNTYDNELKIINNNNNNNNSEYKNGDKSSTPFYIDAFGIKVVSIKKTCSKMSFYYKTRYSDNSYNHIYLYIDGNYYNEYGNNSTWSSITVNNLSNKEHEFTWVLYNTKDDYYSCIDTISFDDVVETDSSLFSNTYDNELRNEFYRNGSNSSTPFYNDTAGIKVVSIKKTCSKMSFYYKTKYNNDSYNYVYLYIDGKYYNKYINSYSSWTLASIDNLSNKEHEFTWVLYNYYDDSRYSCIDTISFNDVVEMDSSLFSNTYDNELKNNNVYYRNGSNSSTPFYNDAIGIKVVSIKKTCSKMSFYYKTKYDNSPIYVYLYIDGKYYNKYANNDTWSSITVNNLSNKEHEFTWVLYNNNYSYYSCIDTISFDDVVETNSSLFSNKGTLQLPEIANNNDYKNGINSSTPFYNDAAGFKVVSIKKTCSKMSFYYKTKYNESYNYIYLYIDGKYYNGYGETFWTLASVNNLSNKEHEFTWVLYNNKDSYYSCIDTISFDDVVETNSSLFSNTYDNELKNNNVYYRYGDNSSTPFYNDTIGFKVVSIKKTCSKMSFYYKTKIVSFYNYIYLYIDGKYYDGYDKKTWTLESVDNLSNKEHEFTWVLYNYNNTYYSCIDTISFDDVVETDSSLFSNTYDNELKNNNVYYRNGSNSSTPFYNNTIGIKVVSIKKTCSKMSFYYQTRNDNSYNSYNYVYLYIDGKYYDEYSNSSWTLASVDNLSNKEHEFTWVLYSYTNISYSCIDTIAFNDVVETDSNLFSNTYDNELLKNEFYKNGYNSSTPFYIDAFGIKVVSIKKTCSKMSFYYKTKYNNSFNCVYLYIDGKYYNRYNIENTWTSTSIDNLSNKEHEFTWVLYNYTDDYYSCIDTIAFNDVVEMDSSLFSNTYDNELQNEIYKNGYNSSTPFYNDAFGIKVVSIKKTCSKMSFYYKIRNYSGSHNYIYLYIDGNYYNKYSNNGAWRLASIDNLSNKEHEFTWVLYDYDDSYYSCIDTISFDDVVETNSSLFSNKGTLQLPEIANNNDYKNGDNSSTPFYNNTIGIKVVSIKKTCSKMSFYYKTKYFSYYTHIYLYIDGKCYNRYSDSSWTLASIDNLSNKEHEFTWVLYNYSNDYYSCIDTIAFNDVVETDSSLFSNTYDNELQNEIYKNGYNSSTPFYNNTIGFKIVSIKKTCSKMSFYYKTKIGSSYTYIYLYIDGKYYNEYSNRSSTWSSITVNNLSNKEHEFTWVLYDYDDGDYSCIDTISFNDVVEMDSRLFSNTYDNELKNEIYKNGYNSSTPFYNDAAGFKVVSIKKTCSKMSFYYKTKDDSSFTYIYLYIDGKYYNKYINSSWTLASIDNLSNKEHEFTWVLYDYTNDYYSCIDTISFDDVVETNSSLFSNTYDNKLRNEFYKNGDKSSTPFYNNTIGFKVVSIKKTCSKMSFYYKTDGCVYLYIDGKYYNKYINSSWTLASIDNLSNKEHEFTWVLYGKSCIDTISFDDVVETNSSLFSNKGTLQLPEIANNSEYKNGSKSSTPFYNNTIGIKIVSIKKTCSKMRFYYKTNSRIYLYIDGNYYNDYYSYNAWSLTTVDNLSNKEHEFTWVLYNTGDRDYSCIDTISFNDTVETNSSLFSNTYDNELKNEFYKNGDKSSTPFYNDAIGIKIVSIKKTCSKMRFYCKTNDRIYLYIDGNYYDDYLSYNVWSSITIDNLSNKEHEFTWVLYYDDYYSCIDTISFNDVVETDSSLFSNTYDNELKNEFYKNGDKSSTPFYNDAIGFKVVSIKKTCSKMSFYYKANSYVYLYIDGNYYDEYYNKYTWTLESIDNLSNKEHEFTWVLYGKSCIDTISFDDVVETNSSLFSNTYDNELQNINSTYKNGSNSSTPFYNDAIGSKVVSIKKTCSKMSFYYKTKYNNDSYNHICLYIDGKYYNRYRYSNDGAWRLLSIENLSNKEHEFTWVLYNYDDNYYSCIDTISFDDTVETNSSLFSNTYDNELKNNNSTYRNGSNSSTPFYNDAIGIKVVSIKKTCSKMSFYYKTYSDSSYNYIYLYIDGKYYNRYYNSNNTWTLTTVNNLTNKEHEFTWVLCNTDNDHYYLCIDTISFDNTVETDSSLFSNTYDNELQNINSTYKNGSNSSTPFYNDTVGSKVVSIKKTCSKMSFYYKTRYYNNSYNYIYLYIDGKYYNRYYNSNNTWTLTTVNNLTNKEHEFTWVLCNTDNDHYYLCIDTISFDDVVETDSSLFSNTYDNELKNNNINSNYKNGDNSSTPFYNDAFGIKVVSIKKTCSKMSFYYKTRYYNNSYSYVCLYIDGKYYNRYSDSFWTIASINNLSNKEHEFTWVLYNYTDDYYSCIDTISFDDVVETNSSLFSNTYDNELQNEITVNPFYFYNDAFGIKVVSIKKTCSKMRFYYKTNSRIYLYIDGNYYNDYYSYNAWSLTTVDNLSNKEHEFTWVLCNTGDRDYSCIDTISFDDVVETNSSLFSNSIESFILKNENIIVVQCDSKIIDFCICNGYFFIDSEYKLHSDYYDIENIKKILNKQIIYYKYSDGSGDINVLFLLDKNNRLKIITDDSDLSGDTYYDGNFYEGIFEALEEVFKNKEIKDIACNKCTNDESIETIYILTKNGEVYESTYGRNKDTDTIIMPENTTVALKYDNIRFLAMKKTEYGIILLGEDGKLYVKGKFVNGEFGLYNTSSITIDGKEYSKAFVSDKLVRVSRDEFLEDGEYKLRNIYTLKLYNTDAYDSGVYVVKEDGKLYYTGKNNGACGEVFGYPSEAQNIDVWTPVENNANDIGRISTPRPDYWSYYFDYIMKSDKNGSGNSVENIFFKIDDVWIDWNAYISKYMNVTLRDADNKILKKYKEFKKTDNSTLRKVINFDSFIEYLKLNKESITNEFKVDRTLIPQVDYIDKDLNVYTINAGDNISCIKYSQKDIDLLNTDLIESLNHNIQLKNEYEDVIEKSQDPEEIFEYQNRLAVIELNIEELNKEIANNQDKLGTMNPNNYFDFNDNRIFNPMTVVGTEEKTINYSKSNFSEPSENGEIKIETEEIDGALHVVKSTVSKTVESNITKLKIDLINYDRLNNSSISDAEVLRDDIKMTIMEDPNDERNFEVDDLLVWLNGKFITKDYIIGNDNKAFCNYNGLAGVDTRRICEFPGYGEPTQNSNNIPTITGENATVIEPTVPTELRWNLSPKVFSWEDVKIDGPYKIHDLNNVNSELRRVEFFYFGDVYCSVFTQFLIKNKICPKNTFILFFDGAVVPEDEYDVSIKGNNTYITLKKFTAYVTSLLQDEVDIMKPGYEGRVRHILSQFDNMSQFSIAFLSSTDKFKKVKMYYDYQTIRDVPKPGQVIFNDIKYNDLILFDGRYIPYLWESRHCIRIPETVNTIRTSENNFIRHSTICRARPYSTYKKESELTDTECRMYAKQNGLVNDEELSTLDIAYIRERVKPHIEARIKEI